LKILEVEMKKIVLLAVLFLFLSSGLSYAIQCKDYFDYFDECKEAGVNPYTEWESKHGRFYSGETVMVSFSGETMKSEEKQCLDIWISKQRLKELKKRR
jgi:hypothetical protein